MLVLVRNAGNEPATPYRVNFVRLYNHGWSTNRTAAAVGVSRGYLYDLLAGKNEPSHAVVVALAKYCDVEVEYFSDTERGQQLQDQFALLADLGANNVCQIAHRARGLDPEA